MGGCFQPKLRAIEGLLRNLGVKPEDRMTEAQAREVIAKPEPVSAEAEAAMTA